MIELTNYVSKIFFKDKSSSFAILTYLDLNKELTKEDILRYLNTIVEKNEILNRRILEKNSQLYIESQESINLENQYSIEYISQNEFQTMTSKVLDEPFRTDVPWQFTFYIDKETSTSRVYFKIHHAYADGYQIIKIFTSPYGDQQIEKKFKRTTSIFNTIYYYVVGTLSLIIMNLQFLLKAIFSSSEVYEETKTDHIECKPFSLEEIKTFTKKHSITVNDFLYSLMIKTDYLYTGKDRLITSASPINISGTKDMNNLCPLFLRCKTNQDNSSLFKTVHDIFNSCKYSVFIPCLSLLLNILTKWISIDTLSLMYKSVSNTFEYAYSNIIGPDLINLEYPVKNIHFLTTAKNREIIFNCISYNDSINIIYSFKKGIIKDKARFEQCVYHAYESLIKTYDAGSPLGP
jgi:hypothetical protein